MKRILIPLILIAAFAVSCKKDKKKSSVPTQSKLSMLTDSRWQVTAASLIIAGGGEPQDLLSTMDPCQQDNLYTFNKTGNITLYENTLKCSDTDPDSTTDGTWTFSSDSSKLTLLGSSIFVLASNISADIVSINGAQLQLKKDTSIVISPSSTLSGTFYATLTNVIRQ